MDNCEAVIILNDGFEDMEAVAVCDTLRRGGVRVALVSITGRNNVISSHGLTVVADSLFEEAQTDLEGCSALILPGGRGYAGYAPHEGLTGFLQRHSEKGGTVAAICAAPTYLGALGMLDGKNAVCYPGMEDGLGNAVVQDGHVAEDGNVITGKGPGSCFDFALTILKRIKGAETADGVMRQMCL